MTADGTTQALLAVDAAHAWHPYAPPHPAVPPVVVTGADGPRLHLADGRTVLDGMSSWWAAVHGYRHPVLDAAVREQLEATAHVMFGGITHGPAVGLVERLVALTPAPLQHVFLCDSGSVSVEVGLKMCLQAQRARGHHGRTRFLTVRGGYHGDTFATMALCDPVGGMHHLFADVLPRHVFADLPPAGFDAPLDEAYAEQLRRLVREHAHELAGVVVEPVVQGAGGMRFWSPAYLQVLREVCDETGVLLVLDEIATGFGRTGAFFACNHAGISPDVLCVGKALTGGYLSMAAALCTADVAESIAAGEGGVLNHGPTFMGNPLAAAVACASIDLLGSSGWQQRVRTIEAGLVEGLAELRDIPGIIDVRVLGAVGVVQLVRPVDVPAASAAALDAGVWLRPFRDLVYTMPPYVCEPEDVATLSRAVGVAARASLAATA